MFSSVRINGRASLRSISKAKASVGNCRSVVAVETVGTYGGIGMGVPENMLSGLKSKIHYQRRPTTTKPAWEQGQQHSPESGRSSIGE
jgi:hypothetical protein